METITPLTQHEIPTLNESQLALFSPESIHASPVTTFDPLASSKRLEELEGARVIAADFGADKGVTQLFIIRDGQLVPDDTYTDYVQGDHGNGYLASLEKTAAYAQQNNLPVGISWGTPLDGTKPLFHPKADHFLAELQKTYNGDIANVIPTLKACLNDGPAGLVSGAIAANQLAPTTSIIFPINGGGIGMAALVNNTLYATEAGHVQAVGELNRYDQTEACNVFGATYLCLERLGANKAGIEAQWQTQTGEYMRARDIEDRYKEGNEFAGELYDNSALILAHAIQGVARALSVDLSAETTAVVGHGGAFKFPHYGERVQQILDQHNGSPSRLIMTKDHVSSTGNACLDGAALAALL